MRRPLLAFLILAAVWAPAAAQEAPAPPPGWHKFESAEGPFVAYFPQAPRFAPDTKGKLKLPHRWVAQNPDGTLYFAAYTDVLAAHVAKVGPKDALFEVRYLLGLENDHVGGRLMTHAGYPAQQLQVRTPEFKFYRSRFLFVGSRLYFWGYIGGFTQEDDDKAERMMDLFVPPK